MSLFYKLYTWIPELGITGNELIVFTVIHSYTEYAGGYAGGLEPLMQMTGLVRSKVYKILASLKDRGYIGLANASRGRVHSTYVSLVNRPTEGTVESSTVPSTVPYRGHNRPPEGTLLDNRYIDNPPTPLKGGSENAGAKSGERRRPRGASKPSRALNYLRGNTDYSEQGLHNLGISTGEEFYKDEATEAALDEIRTR